MVAPVLSEAMIGWFVGTVVGTVVARRARSRYADADPKQIEEAWALIGVAGGVVVGLVRELS